MEPLKPMAKYNEKRLPYDVQDKLIDAFCEVLAKLKTKQQIKDFLKDLLNRKERAMLVRRLLIAILLVQGKTYTEIGRELKCGRATIARIERWLNFGRGGYKKAIASWRMKF
ncbi:MAG: YerC/YecD family TrpR-related protein [Parcubacteria group bacterium]